ncbi:MAG: hypothetical protein OXG37_13145 [Actinomycetia bacterium]|nr:hypothetical protein [Actinomycetes bacterium]
MLELSPVALTIVACAGEAPALDALATSAGGYACRIAPDELWLLGAPGDGRRLLERARAGVVATGGLAETQTDAWSVYAAAWPEAAELFARLAAVPLGPERPVFVQCELVHVAGKALALADRLYLLVPSPVGHQLEERILHGCRDLAPRRGPPVDFGAPAPGAA